MRYFKLPAALAFVCLSAFSYAFAEESFESFAMRLDSWVSGLNGVVVSASDKNADIDLGAAAGVVKGMVFSVTRPGEELIHPVTGASLGRKTIILGELTVNGVYDKYSSASYKGSEKLSPGDNVGFRFPVPVKLVFSGFTDGEKAEASYAVLKSGMLSEEAESDYTVSCARSSPEIREASCALVFKGGVKIVSAEVPVSAVVVTSASSSVRKSGSGAYEEGMRLFGEKFVSAAAGFFFGRNGGLTVAAAESGKAAVFAYSPENGFRKVWSVSGDFEGIINVELADVDGDGADELFISGINGEGKAESRIYAYKSGAVVPVGPKTGCLFRTFYSGGRKTVICQRFEEGDFTGPIAPYVFKDGVYSAGPAYGGTSGYRLYGFGETSAGEISFGAGGGLIVRNAGGAETYGGYFGDTPHRFQYTKQILKGVSVDKDGAEINDVEKRIVAASVYQRIIEISKGKFLLTGNVPVERRAVGEDEYKNSFYGIYVLLAGSAEPFWYVPAAMPAVAEADVARSGEKTYILILKNFRSGFLGASGSGLRIIEADIK